MTRRALLFATLAVVAPAGVAGQTGPAVARAGVAALGVDLDVTEVHFDLDGETLPEVRERLDALGPLGPLGPKAHAVTDFRLRPLWSPYRLPEGCVVRGMRVDLDIEIRLPRWAGEVQAASGERLEWRAFQRAIRDHEHAHRDATVRAALLLAVSLRDLTASTCPRLVQRVAGLLRHTRTDLHEAHQALDVRQPRVTRRR